MGVWALAQAATVAPARAEEIYISQIPPDLRGLAMQAPLLGQGGLPGLEATVLAGGSARQLSEALDAASNSSIIVQRGRNNSAVVAIVGSGNATLQVQIGANLDSAIDVDGNRNLVAVDQRGYGWDSEITVDGDQQRILHIQRGYSPHDFGPIDTADLEGDVAVVVDTAAGRRIYTPR